MWRGGGGTGVSYGGVPLGFQGLEAARRGGAGRRGEAEDGTPAGASQRQPPPPPAPPVHCLAGACVRGLTRRRGNVQGLEKEARKVNRYSKRAKESQRAE